MNRSSTYRNYNKSSAPKRFQKRWYVDASIPKAVPFIGGSTFKAGSGSLNKRSLSALVRSEARSLEAVKLKATQVNTVTLLDDTWYTLNPLGNIPIGTGEVNRLSTDIFVKSVKLRMTLTNNSLLAPGIVNNPVHFRMMWVRTSVPVLASSDLFASGLGNSDLVSQGNDKPLYSIIDTDKVTVLSDTIVTVAPYHAAQTISKFVEFDCPLTNFPFNYSTSTSNFSTRNKNLYCLITPKIVGGVSGTTTDASLSYSFCTKFTDSR